jgi:hypothetical protein
MRSYGFTPDSGRLAIAWGLLISFCGVSQAGTFSGSLAQGGSSTPTQVLDFFTAQAGGTTKVGVTQSAGGITANISSTSSFYNTANPAGNWASTSEGGGFLWQGTVTDATTVPLTPGPVISNLVTFCLEINEQVHGNHVINGPFTVSSSIDVAPKGEGMSMGVTAANYIRELWYRDSGYALSTSATTSINSTVYTAAQVNAAFQLAIWKLEYDANSGAHAHGLTYAAGLGSAITGVDWNDKTGNMYVSGGYNTTITGLATYMLTQLTTPNATNTATLYALLSDTYQDQLFGPKVPTPNVGIPVPEPASLVTWLLLGFVATSANLRRRGKAAA